MPKFFACFGDVARHGEMHLVPLIIPIQGKTNVFLSFPIFCDGIMLLENANQMLRMLLSNILDAKVVYHERGLDWMPIMCPKARYDHALFVTFFIQSLF